MSRSTNVVELLNYFNKIHNNKYDYSKFIFVKMKEKSTIICPIHGKFEKTPDKHKAGQGCSKCNGNYIFSKSEIIDKINKIWNNKYKFIVPDNFTYKTKIKCNCPNHGNFEQTIEKIILLKRKCKICKKNEKTINYLNINKNKNNFLDKANKIHNYKYDYSQINYINAKTKIKIICLKHNDKNNYFYQIPNSHLSGVGCPRCSSSKGEIKISNFLISNKINFEQEKKFDDCLNPKSKRKLSFDFYINKYNMIIEYDGEQHYNPLYFGNTSNKTIDDLNKLKKDKFEKTKFLDEIKNNYCKNKNINLIRIKYNENNFEEIILNYIKTINI